MRRPNGPRSAAALLALVGLVTCRNPTEIVVQLTTDEDCANVRETSIAAGPLGAVDTTAGATATECTAGSIGSIVIVPSGGNTDEVGIEIVTAVGVPLDACTPPAFGPGCIVARRAIGFIPHTPLTLPIAMRAACLGKVCEPGFTCAAGRCVSAQVDPAKCIAPGGCDESTLGGSDADAGAVEAGDDATVDAGAGDASGDAIEERLPSGTACVTSSQCVQLCCCSFDNEAGTCDGRSGCTRLSTGTCL